MAIAFETITLTSSASSESGFTLTKPTGLAVGDKLIMIVTFSSVTSTVLLSGWTDRPTSGASNSSIEMGVQYKTATAGDVAASNFTWDFFGANTSAYNAVLMRISGAADFTITDAFGDDIENDATPTFTFSTPITPDYSNSLLIAAIATNDASTTAVSAYSISVSNPTWTERADSTTGYKMGVATAVRPETTAVGTLSATLDSGSAGADSIAYLMAVTAEVNASVTNTLLDVSPSFNTPTNTNTVGVTNSLLSVSPSFTSPTTNTIQEIWTNEAKSSTTWVNQDKS